MDGPTDEDSLLDIQIRGKKASIDGLWLLSDEHGPYDRTSADSF